MQKFGVLLLILFFAGSISAQNANFKISKDKQDGLQKVLDTSIDNKKIFGVSFCLKYKGDIWCSSAGNLGIDDQYYVASVTKLFVTAIVLRLREEKLLSLDDKISIYLDRNILQGLHTYKGTDYSEVLTIKHLLAHTSGIPDYFEHKGKQGKSLLDELIAENDQSWTFEDAIAYSKSFSPYFSPETKGKARYSDTNYQLLGRIIENITKKPLEENFQELIFRPLKMDKTYLYSDTTDNTPKLFFYKKQELHLPKAMASFGADGGIVSTSSDLLVFYDAFMNGILFPKEYIPELQAWNKLFTPIKSGIGILQIRLPFIFDPMRSIPELIGYSGLSGAIVYYSPKEDLFIVGTVNQAAYPDIPIKQIIKLIRKVIN